MVPIAIIAVVATFVIVWASSRSGGSKPAAAADIHTASGTTTSATPSTAAVPASASATLQVPVDPTQAPAPPGIPTRVVVPSIGVDSTLEHLGLLKDGTLAPNATWDHAGWYDAGVRPGAVGPAIIAGHVDSYMGPAVFFRLKQIKAGAAIAVYDSTGAVRTFVVTDVKEYPKDHFPTDAVYGPTVLPVLRLVTCTGDFDYTARSYLDNLVVSADLK